ncbi:hypothetical protein BGX33_005755 [Mortierella sp. NVP41]|nr:hypothetical protein BGX33_005755 [Mortierella sp. NVP41]
MDNSKHILPEILEAISSYLSPPDFLKCVQVCRAWHSSFTPYLWDSIDDSMYSWPRLIRMHDSDEAQETGFDENWILRTFAKHNQYIQHLHIHFNVTIRAACNQQYNVCCPNLKSLLVSEVGYQATIKEQADWIARHRNFNPVMGGTPLSERKNLALMGPFLIPEFYGVLSPAEIGLRTETQQEQGWMAVQQIWTLIRVNSGHLRVLDIDSSLGRLARLTSNMFIYDTLSGLQQLAHLAYTPSSLDLSSVLTRSPGLKSLTLWPQTEERGPILDRTFVGLRSFEVHSNLSFAHVVSLLSHLPQLEHLSTSRISSPPNADDEKRLAELPAPLALKSLRIRRTGFYDILVFRCLFPRLPNLTQIKLRRIEGADVDALVTLLPQLESVVDTMAPVAVTPHMALQPCVMARLLQSCRELRTLDGMNHRFHGGSDFEEPWVCVRLDTFRAEIRAMTRLRETEELLLPSVTIESQSETVSLGIGDIQAWILSKYRLYHEQHSRVYDRLASLVHLTVLILGYDHRSSESAESYSKDGTEYLRYSEPAKDVLELSLVSGLDRLSSLKSLEVFGFEGMDHRIGVPELDWIAVSWPRLRLMCGLHRDTLLRIEFDERKAELRRHMRMIRPDVEHRGWDTRSQLTFLSI